ncbi:MAG TPA: hypothetical protein VHN37_07640 [Actinomycetota bacterium]|nr:hypothetical protein [Actinomycetota bacterium]
MTTRRTFLGVALALLLIAGAATPARAALWTGACALRATIDFHSPARAPLSTPSYGLSVTGAADLDLMTAGVQPCAFTLAGSAFGGTSAGGEGNAVVWSCAETVARGSWDQSFDDEGPAGFSGTHVLTGSWGAWTLHVQSSSLNAVGVGEMTLQAAEALETPSCAAGQLSSVTMVGVLVFQDP